MRNWLACLLTALGVQTCNWLYLSVQDTEVGRQGQPATADLRAKLAATDTANAKLAVHTADLEAKLAMAHARLSAATSRAQLAAATAAAAAATAATTATAAAAATAADSSAGRITARVAGGPRVLCFVPVGPPPEPDGGPTLRAIMRTWGRRCDGLLFLGPVGYELAAKPPTEEQMAAAAAPAPLTPRGTLPQPWPAKGYATLDSPAKGVAAWQTQPLVIEEVKGCIEPAKRIDRDSGGRLWRCMHRVWWHVFERYGDRFDWFLKVDDDTYALVDNFRALAAQLEAREPAGARHPLYVGHTVFNGIPEGGHNLGAGYAVNAAALKAVSPELPGHPAWTPLRGERGCRDAETWAEDEMFSQCLRAAGIRPHDARDEMGRERFVPFHVVNHLHMTRWKQTEPDWFWKNKPTSTGWGLGCCARELILTHGFKGAQGAEAMQELDYLLYHVRVHDRDAEVRNTAATAVQMQTRRDPQPSGKTWKGFAVWDATRKEYANEQYA
jgi:hypothetical protein